MKKLLLGLSVITAVATTTGFAAAHNGGGTSQPDLSGYTKDQCKNGGWRALGFRNQGECVSYFARQQRGTNITNNNNIDVNARTDQTSVSGSVEVSNNGSAGDALSGNASNSSSTSVGVSVSN